MGTLRLGPTLSNFPALLQPCQQGTRPPLRCVGALIWELHCTYSGAGTEVRMVPLCARG